MQASVFSAHTDWLSGCEMQYVQYLFGNFCVNYFPSCNGPKEYTVSETDSVCIWTVIVKEVRKSPSWASSFLCCLCLANYSL